MISETTLENFSDANSLAKDLARLAKVSVKIIKDNDQFKLIGPKDFDLTPYLSGNERIKVREKLLNVADQKINDYKQLIEAEKKKSEQLKDEKNQSIIELQKILSQEKENNKTLQSEINNLSSNLNQYQLGTKGLFEKLSAAKLISFCNHCSSKGMFQLPCPQCKGDAVKKEIKKNFDLCTACSGTGGNDGSCWKCSGTGFAEDIIAYSPCVNCKGSGSVQIICNECYGYGMNGKDELLKPLSEFIKSLPD